MATNLVETVKSFFTPDVVNRASARLGESEEGLRRVVDGGVPVVFAGLRIGLSRAVQGMVTAELLFAVTGLGGLVMTNSANYRIDKMLVVRKPFTVEQIQTAIRQLSA